MHGRLLVSFEPRKSVGPSVLPSHGFGPGEASSCDHCSQCLQCFKREFARLVSKWIREYTSNMSWTRRLSARLEVMKKVCDLTLTSVTCDFVTFDLERLDTFPKPKIKMYACKCLQ